jgi:ATP-dependent DNA helicase RecG
MSYPDSKKELTKLLQNMNLATDKGVLNLAGALLFAEKPEMIKPQFVVKAIRFPGNKIHVSEYEDTEDFEGPLSKVFDDSMSFIMRNLDEVQAGRGVNAPGTPQIPQAVFEELLVNALVHRDYLIDAPIRIFIFCNRIEIISPGCLSNNLTVEKIKTGNSNIRNPILVSYAAKGLLPYHGIGSGITRALEEWSEIEFEDMRDGGQFKAVVSRALKGHREEGGDPKKLEKGSKKPVIGSGEAGGDPKKYGDDPKKALEESILTLMRTPI